MMSRYSVSVEKSCVVIGKAPEMILYDSYQWFQMRHAACADFQISLWLAILLPAVLVSPEFAPFWGKVSVKEKSTSR